MGWIQDSHFQLFLRILQTVTQGGNKSMVAACGSLLKPAIVMLKETS